MKKLVRGIVEFRKKMTPEHRARFAQLALGQSPDALFIACSDSRVAANAFASTDPGDLFVVRNVGNLIPPCREDGRSIADESEAAAIEFALTNLSVKDIIVCGHSECGAMQAIAGGRRSVAAPNLRSWLRHGEAAFRRVPELGETPHLSPTNRLSQLNVLQQLVHVSTYPTVREGLDSGRLRLHAWWFELQSATVHAYEAEQRKFVVIDEEEAQRILARETGDGA